MPAAPSITAPSRSDTQSPRGIAAWCLFDFANSAFNTVIGTFVFSVFFTRAVAVDEVTGTAQWANALAVAGLAVAILSPVLGAIADQAGRRKPWIALFVTITCIGSAMLWWVEPDPAFVMLALVLVAVATITFELALVFYNAMLTDLAPRGMTGRVSGWAWGVGYVGGLGCLVVALIGFVQAETPWFGVGTENAANIRATGPLVAAWFALFALPLFLFTPDKPSTGMPLTQAVRTGLATLVDTLGHVRRYGNIARFLIASALYRDGLSTLFAFGGIYAAGTFGMEFSEIVIFAIALNVASGAGAIAFAWIDDRIGPRQTIIVSLLGLIALGGPLLLIESKTMFWVLALGLGIFVGPAQAASRSWLAQAAPTGIETEIFGLYAFTGKAVGFLGPLALGIATETFDSQRAGMATIVLFFLAGLGLLLTVKPIRAPVAR